MFNFSTKKPSIKTILGYILYAQGLPTLITVLTIIIDEAGPCDITRPNMGRFKCFVQTQHGTVDSFFQSAQFLHFHLTMGILIIVNIICFLITGISLCSHWRNMTHVNLRFNLYFHSKNVFIICNCFSSACDGITNQFKVVLKIFIIMGIPLIFDFFSKWLEFNWGGFHSYLTRLSLDLVHLTWVTI